MENKEKLGLIVFLRDKDIRALLRGLWTLEGALVEKKETPDNETLKTIEVFFRLLMEVSKGYEVTIKGEHYDF